ncbi:6298_t:CDS:2, partial [Scutellospora calospora]
FVSVTEKLMDELAQCYNVLPQLDINNTIDHRPEGDEKWFLENEKTVTQFCRKLAAERPLKDIRDEYNYPKKKGIKDECSRLLEASTMKSRRGFAIQRLMNAMRQAHADGWFIVFDTLTLADDRLEAFYDNPNALRDYFRDIGRMVLAAEGRKANDSHADCYQYFCVPEYGTANGRLHFHAVHFMRTLPTGSVDPNFGRRDAFSRSGWLWPVDAKGEPLKATSYMAVGFYVAKYVNKKSDMDLAAKAVATSQEAVQNQNEPQLRDENAHNDKSVHGVLNPTYQAGLRRDAVQPDIEAERKKRDEIEAGKSYCSRRFGGATCDDKSAQIYARFDKNDWLDCWRKMRKFDLSLRSSRSSYFATFRHQLTILSKTDALDEEKWLNMLGTFVKDWFRYESHFVHGRDSLVDILKERGLLSESDAVQPLIVTEQSVRFQTALASIKLIQASAVLDLTEDDFDFLTSNKVWIATDRSRARRCVEACVYGTLDFVGYPRFPAPVEFIAAVIAYYVHPVNIQTACLIMEGAEFTENIINGVERPVKAAELFAFTLRVRAGNTDVLTDAEENPLRGTKGKRKGARLWYVGGQQF